MNQAPDEGRFKTQFRVDREDLIHQMNRMMFRTPHYLGFGWMMLLGLAMLWLHDFRYVGLLFIIFPPILVISFRWNLKRMVDQHPELLETQSLSFDTSGITISNSVSTHHWPWSRVKKANTTERFIVLKTDQFGSGVIIPMDALDPDAQNALFNFARHA